MLTDHMEDVTECPCCDGRGSFLPVPALDLPEVRCDYCAGQGTVLKSEAEWIAKEMYDNKMLELEGL